MSPAQSSRRRCAARQQTHRNGGPVHSFHSLLRRTATCTLNEMTTTLNHAYSFPGCYPTPIRPPFTLLDVDPTKLSQ